MEIMWAFKTEHFEVRARIVPDYDVDASFDETGETAEKLASGEYVAFGTIVEVIKNGHVIGSDSLWASIYEDAGKFFTDHRTSPREYRNTLDKKAARVCICHYFPDMVATAIADARNTLRVE